MIQRSVLLLAFVSLLSVAAYAFEQPRPLAPFDGPLTGKELLLQLQDLSGQLPAGIYALDPFAEKPEPRLLVPNGERPVWSRTRKYFAYLHAGDFCVADREGGSWRLYGSGPLGTEVLRGDDPPARWTSGDGLLFVSRNPDTGTLVWLLTTPDTRDWPPALWRSPALSGLPEPVTLALKPGAGGLSFVPWSEVYACRGADYSPSSGGWALELAPAAPFDMLRERSKLYWLKDARVQAEAVCQLAAGMVGAELSRVTALPESVGEVEPRLSPDGQWISFTAVHYDEHYVAAAVCRPDGSDYMELLPDWGPGVKPRPPATPNPKIIREETFVASQAYGWGALHVVPVDWSDDSQSLLLRAESPLHGWYLATYREGAWSLVPYGPATGSVRTLAPTRFLVAVGPSVEERPAVAYRTSSKEVRVFTAPNTAGGKAIKLQPDVRLLWLDW